MTLHDFVNDPPEDEGADAPSRMIDADVTAALDRWAAVPKDGGPEHQAASEALDDLLEELCIYRGLATNEYADARAWQHLMVRYADELERLGHPLPTRETEFKSHADDAAWQANVLGPSREEQALLGASAARTRDWLKREGFAIAAAARGPSHGEKR
jgi:hypothetical protein